MAARQNSSHFHMRSWNVHGTKQLNHDVSFKMEIPLLKFDVNGDVVIIENIQNEVELWSIRNVVPKEIPFPKYDSFLKGDEKSLDCHWVLGEGEKFLVALFSTDC